MGEITWEIHGRYMGDTWEIHERYMGEITWESLSGTQRHSASLSGVQKRD